VCAPISYILGVPWRGGKVDLLILLVTCNEDQLEDMRLVHELALIRLPKLAVNERRNTSCLGSALALPDRPRGCLQ